ncbi:UNVERIFIED_CONTAM: hypothetical protein GTU68_059624 [Idotea baltica]|nr:hypothetical protein [Idotea baltica]
MDSGIARSHRDRTLNILLRSRMSEKEAAESGHLNCLMSFSPTQKNSRPGQKWNSRAS